LQALADALPRDDYLFGTDGNTTRVRIALALGDLDRAAVLLRTTSQTMLDNWSKLDDPRVSTASVDSHDFRFSYSRVRFF